MSNKFFLRKTHVNISFSVIVVYITIVILLIFIAINHNKIATGLVLIFIICTLITFLLVKYFSSIGLYINGKNIYYKNFKTQYINCNQISGIKIIASYGVGGKFRGFYPLKDSRGEFLYSAIILKAISDEMLDYQKGDLWFNENYKKQIICSAPIHD